MMFWRRKKKCLCGNIADTKHKLVITGQNNEQKEYQLCQECVDALENSGKVVDKERRDDGKKE